MRMQSDNRRFSRLMAVLVILTAVILTACTQENDSGEQVDEIVHAEATTEPMATATIAALPEPTEAATPIPLSNGETLSLAWTYDTGDAINHPPLRVGDLIIVVPVDGALMALDAETGVLRWRYDPPQQVWDRAYASDGDLIFIGLEGGDFVALDSRTGELRWQTELGIDSQIPSLIVDDTIYVSTTFVGPKLSNDPEGKAKLFALNAADGSEIWQVETDNYILQTPFLEGDKLFAAGVYHDPQPVDEGGHTRLYAFSPDDGDLLWAYESEDGFPKQLYATETAVVFIAYQDYANGIDTTSGELLWRHDTGNWVPNLSGAGDTVYFGSANTVVHALNVNDGSVEWQHNIKEGTFNYILGAPVRIGDDLIFLSQHGDIMALNADDGSLRWQFPTGIASRTGLSVANEQILIGDENGVVYAYTSRD